MNRDHQTKSKGGKFDLALTNPETHKHAAKLERKQANMLCHSWPTFRSILEFMQWCLLHMKMIPGSSTYLSECLMDLFSLKITLCVVLRVKD